MFEKNRTKVIIIEVILIISSIIGWVVWKKLRSPYLNSDLLIDTVALIGVVTLILFRSSNPRHYWYGFAFLVLTSISTLFKVDTMANISAGISLSFFSLGVANQLLFRK